MANIGATNLLGGLDPLWEEALERSGRGVAKTEQPVFSFADIFRSAIAEAQANQAEVDKASYLLSTGQLENPAYATISVAKANLSLSMLVQLRNKALDAYNELMRISM